MNWADTTINAIHSAWAWLGSMQYAQSVAILLVSFGVPWFLRTVIPKQWVAVTRRLTKAVRPRLGETLTAAWSKAIQAVPSLLAAAAFSAIVEGADLGALLRFELHAVFAPLIHESMKAYKGGRFPAAGSASALLLLLCLPLVGCTSSLQQQRIEGQRARAVGTLSAASVDRCESLDDTYRWAGAIGKVAAAGAVSAAGLAASGQIADERAERGLIIGAAVSGAIGAGALLLSESSSGSYVRECSR